MASCFSVKSTSGGNCLRAGMEVEGKRHHPQLLKDSEEKRGYVASGSATHSYVSRMGDSRPVLNLVPDFQ
jgi:hypothetical protein